MTNRSRAWAAVAVWVAIQLSLTSLPGKSLPIGLDHPWDWGGHFCLYGGLGALIARAAVLRGWSVRHLIWAGVLVSAGAALDELHQLFIPDRSAEFFDWLSDTVGAVGGLTVGARLMTSRFAKWLR